MGFGCRVPNKEAPSTGVTQNLPRRSIGTRYSVDAVGPVTPPSRSPSIEVPVKDTVVAGWAVDDLSKSAAANVDVVLDHVPYAAHYGLPRKDVAASLNNPGYEYSGFQYTIPASQLTKGIHVFAIRVVSADGKSYVESPELMLVAR